MPTLTRWTHPVWIAGALAAVGVCVWFAVMALGRRPDDVAEAKKEFDSRELKKAAARLDRHLTRHPDDTDALLLAAKARRAGEFYAASVLLQKYRAAGGSADDVATEERLARVQGGNLANADALLAVPDDHPDAFFTLEAVLEGCVADVLAQDRDRILDPTGPAVARAKRVADRLLACRMSPADQAQAHYWRATVLLRANDHPPAVVDLRRAVELAPDDAHAREDLAIAIDQQFPNESIAHLEYLLKRDPGEVRLRYSLASIRRAVGQTDMAIELLDQLLFERPRSAQILTERGLAEMDAGRPAAAEKYLQAAYAAAPNDAETNWALSRCLRVLGRGPEANRLYAVFEDLDAKKRRLGDRVIPKK